MRTCSILLFMVLFSAAKAQTPHGTCPHPPCAPGVAVNTPSGQVQITCKNWNSLDCMTIIVDERPRRLNDLKPGDDGMIDFYEESGKLRKCTFTDFKGTDAGKASGEVVVTFATLKDR